MIDWGQMFFGDGDAIFLVEIVIRTAILYGFALFMIRLMGKRGMAQLTPFEFVIIVALGSAVGDPMFYPDVPLIHGIAVIVTVVVAQRLIARLTTIESVERLLEGQPLVVIEDGRILEDLLDREDFTKEELYELLRLNGVAKLSDVKRAVLEDIGRLSVLRMSAADEGFDEQMWPPPKAG